jgi:rRNA-processing protein FCF1
MPYDKTTHSVITVVVPKEIKNEFKKLAKKHRRSVSAHAVCLFEKSH